MDRFFWFARRPSAWTVAACVALGVALGVAVPTAAQGPLNRAQAI